MAHRNYFFRLYQNKSSKSKVKFRHTSNHCRRVFEAVKLTFFIRVFFHRQWWFIRQQENGGGPFSFLSTTSTHSQIFRNLFETLHVRWLPNIFNCSAFMYQNATRWDSPSYWITIWVIDDGMLISVLFTWWFDSRLFITAMWHGKPVDLNLLWLSPLYYKRTD